MKDITEKPHQLPDIDLHIGGYITLASGTDFYPFDPRPELMFMDDVNHALANQCRYGGHSAFFYSVLTHSILVSHLTPREFALEGLLHDAPETWFIDVPTPIKRMIPILSVVENKIAEVFATKMGLNYPWPHEVHLADRAAFHLEWESLMRRKVKKSRFGFVNGLRSAFGTETYHNPLYDKLRELDIPTRNIEKVRVRFLERFDELYFERFGRECSFFSGEPENA